MSTVYLGNDNQIGKVRTTVRLPEGTSPFEALVTITDASDGVWTNHSSAPAPRWVASDDAELASIIGTYYNIEVREPRPEGERNEFPEEVENV